MIVSMTIATKVGSQGRRLEINNDGLKSHWCCSKNSLVMPKKVAGITQKIAIDGQRGH